MTQIENNTENRIAFNAHYVNECRFSARDFVRFATSDSHWKFTSRHAQFAIGEVTGFKVACQTVWVPNKSGKQTRFCSISIDTGVCVREEMYKSWKEAIATECEGY